MKLTSKNYFLIRFFLFSCFFKFVHGVKLLQPSADDLQLSFQWAGSNWPNLPNIQPATPKILNKNFLNKKQGSRSRNFLSKFRRFPLICSYVLLCFSSILLVEARISLAEIKKLQTLTNIFGVSYSRILVYTPIVPTMMNAMYCGV